MHILEKNKVCLNELNIFVCLLKVLIAETLGYWMKRWLMNKELEKIWKKVVMVCLKYCSSMPGESVWKP